MPKKIKQKAKYYVEVLPNKDGGYCFRIARECPPGKKPPQRDELRGAYKTTDDAYNAGLDALLDGKHDFAEQAKEELEIPE